MEDVFKLEKELQSQKNQKHDEINNKKLINAFTSLQD